MKNRHARTLIALAFAGVVTVGTAGCGTSGRSAADPETAAPRVIAMESQLAFDASDPTALAGWADAIFVGTVNEFLGTETAPDREVPESQFQVNVLETLKGELPETVIVNQSGGVAENGDEFESVDSPKLEPGKTYLLSTRIYAAKGWLTVSSIGVVEIPDTVAAQRSAEIPGPDAAEPSAVQAMRDAIANQTPYGDEATRPDLPDPEAFPTELNEAPAGPPTEGTPAPTPTPTAPATAEPGEVTTVLPQPGALTTTAVPTPTN